MSLTCHVSAVISGRHYLKKEKIVLCNFEDPLQVSLDEPASMEHLKLTLFDSFFQPTVMTTDPRKEDLFSSISDGDLIPDNEIDESGDLQDEFEYHGGKELYIKLSLVMPTDKGLNGKLMDDERFEDEDEKKETMSLGRSAMSSVKSRKLDKVEEFEQGLLEKQLECADRQIEKLKGQLSEKERMIEEYGKRIAGLNRRLEESDRSFADVSSMNEQLRESNATQARRIIGMQSEIESLTLKISDLDRLSAELTQELSAKNDRLSKLKTTLATEQTEKVQIERSLDVKTKALSDERAAHLQTQKLLADLQAQLSSVTESALSYSTAKKALQTELQSAREQFDRETEQLKQQLVVLEKKNDIEMASLRSELDKTREQYNESLTQVETMESQMTKQTAEKDGHIAKLTREVDSSVRSLTEEKSKREQSEKELEKLRSELINNTQAADNEVNSLKEQLDHQRKEYETKIAKLEKSHGTEMDLMRSEIQIAFDQCEVSVNQLSDLKEQIKAELESRDYRILVMMAEEKSKNEDNARRLQDLRFELETAKESAQKELAEKTALQTELESLRQSFDEEKTELTRQIVELKPEKSSFDTELIIGEASQVLEDCQSAVIQIEDLKRQIQHMEEMHQSDKKEWESKMEEMRGDLVAIQDDADESAACYQSIQRKLQSAEQQYIAMQSQKDEQITQLSQEISKLRESLSSSGIDVMSDWSVMDPQSSPSKGTEPKSSSDSDSFEHASLADLSSQILRKSNTVEKSEVVVEEAKVPCPEYPAPQAPSESEKPEHDADDADPKPPGIED